MPIWLTFILGALGPLGDFIAKLLQGRQPPAPVQQQAGAVTEGEKAGAAEAALKDQQNADATEQKGADAVASVERRIDTPDGLRKFEASDPYNRDNHKA